MEENKNENVQQEENQKAEEVKEEIKDNKTSEETKEEVKENKASEEAKEQEKNEGELKKEAAENKEQIKNMKIKEDAQKGKGRLTKLFSDPVGTIKEIVKDDKNQFYKTAIFIIGLWVVVILLKQIINFLIHEYYTFNALGVIKLMLAPILEVLVMAVIIHILNKEHRQPLTKAITLVAVAKIPYVISACLGFLTYISSRMSYITSPVYSLLSVISTVLMFFVIKEMFKEKENSLKAFIKVEVVYYIAVFVFSFLGISI